MKIVITGGPGTGKTSIIKALKKRGFHVHPEVSREIINKYRKLGHKQLFLSDPLKFSKILMEKRIIQHKNSNENKNKFYFFDRGIPDIIAYLNFKKVKFNPSLLKEIKNYTYDLIFLCEPWKQIYINDSERYESYSELLLINKELKKTYQKLDYKPIKLPESSVEERINYILNSIK